MLKSAKLFFLLFLFLSIQVLPQSKNLTLKQVTLQSYSLRPDHISSLDWIPGTDSFAFIDNVNGEKAIVKEDASSSNKTTLINFNDFKKVLDDAGIEAPRSFPRYSWISKDEIRFLDKGNLIIFNITKHEAKSVNSIPEDAENVDITANNLIAYTIKNNLYYAVNGNQYQITFDEDENIINGQAVHRNEFGINSGIFWSPDGNYIAFYHMDQRMVTDYPLVDISTRPASLKMIKYPMAGMTSHQVKVGVYSLKTNDIVWLKTGEPKDHYLTGVAWSPDENNIFIGILNRDQNHLQETKYDITTGDPVKILFEEKSEKYVEPEHGPIFPPNSKDKFVWFSKRDGWNHLYLYNTEGKMLKKLTEGDWSVKSIAGFDKDGENIFIYATKESPIENHYYKLNISSGDMDKLTGEPGTHRVEKSSDSKYFIDSYNNLTTPNKIVLTDNNGKAVRDLLDAENPLKDYKIGKTKIFKLKDNAGYDLYSRIIYPPDFDSTKTYRALVYVYGGPHVQLVTNSWLAGAGLWLNYMAEQGYIVFTLDNRGSANRGLKFEQETFRQLGTKEIEDQTVGVNYLRSLPYVDGSRIGVFGWSFGGFMATSLMTRTPDLFKVGVGGGAVIDWSYYEVMYTERYMDTPQANPEGFEKANLLNYVKDLKGKLLLVHGTMDPTVVWQNTLMFAKKAADLGIPLDYFPYPGQEHGVRGRDAFQLYQKITNYFNDNL